MFEDVFSKEEETSSSLSPLQKKHNKYKRSIKETLESYSRRKIDIQVMSSNPQIIRGFIPGTKDKQDPQNEQEEGPKSNHFTLVLCTWEKSKRGPMVFYNLNLRKVVKVLTDGLGFISYKKADQPDRYGLLTYLSDKTLQTA